MRRTIAIAAVLVVGLAACSSTKGEVKSSATTTATTPSSSESSPSDSSSTSSPPAEKTVWLCRPGQADDPCTSDLSSTALAVDGTPSPPVQTKPAGDPKIDCFYVYPTVSAQPGPNADLTVDPQEREVAIQQASRFSSVCRVYAPMYRQLTLSAILNTKIDRPAAQALADQDVLTAWQEYLRDFNKGRGVVFIGHSQGSFELIKLLAQQVDPNPGVRKLLVSALLMGGNVRVPVGKTVGGDFQHIPTCGSATQTGCVIAYSSFSQTPPNSTYFGKANSAGLPAAVGPVEVACTNPASLGGGSAGLDTYLQLGSIAGTLGGVGGVILGATNMVGAAKVTTPWVEWKGRYQASCVNDGSSNVLMVTPNGGAPVLTASPTPEWGTHVVDVNLALGNLVDDVRTEAAHYPG